MDSWRITESRELRSASRHLMLAAVLHLVNRNGRNGELQGIDRWTRASPQCRAPSSASAMKHAPACAKIETVVAVVLDGRPDRAPVLLLDRLARGHHLDLRAEGDLDEHFSHPPVVDLR